MPIQKDDRKNERVQDSLSGQDIEICSAQAECSGHEVVESSIPMSRPLHCWFSSLVRLLVPAAETDGVTTVNKRQHRKLVVYSALVVFSSLVIVVGIAIAGVTAKSNMAARTNEIEFSTRPAVVPTVRAESASIGLGDHPLSREDFEACTTELSHPPLPGKKGAAFTLRDAGQSGSWVENLPKVIQLKPYWNYSWGPKRIAQQPDDIEFVPMLWTGNNAVSLQAAITNNLVPQIQSGHAKRLLGFNEPDNPTQANMPVETALDVWPQLEQTNLPLISPSCWHPEREVRALTAHVAVVVA
jgi:Glycosyl hydrolase catalytic core